MEQRRHPSFGAIVIPVIIGITAIFTVSSRPRFASYHAVDVLELVAAGACFGVALVWLLLRLSGKGGFR